MSSLKFLIAVCIVAIAYPCVAVAELMKCTYKDGTYSYKDLKRASSVCKPLQLDSKTVATPDGFTYHQDQNGCKVNSKLFGSQKPVSLVWSGRCDSGYVSGAGVINAITNDGSRITVDTTYIRGKESGSVRANILKNDMATSLDFEARDGVTLPRAAIRYSGGDTYSGEISTSSFQPHGQGRYTYRNGNAYEGGFLNGLQHGSGVLTLVTGDQLFGLFTKGNPPTYGRWKYAKGHVYEGELANLQENGKGVLRYAGGKRTFRGSFKDGIPDGEGIMDDTESGSFVVVADGPEMHIKNLDKYAEILARNRASAPNQTTENECMQKAFALYPYTGQEGHALAAAGACRTDPTVNDNIPQTTSRNTGNGATYAVCNNDLDCGLGNKCVKSSRDINITGVCVTPSDKFGNSRPDYSAPKVKPTNVGGCSFDTDCNIGFSCLKRSGQIYGVCVK